MVKRYDLEQPDSHMGSASMKEESHGDWVRYEDHRLAVALLVQKVIDGLTAEFQHRRGTIPVDVARGLAYGAILALADTEPLAEVQALKAERDRFSDMLVSENDRFRKFINAENARAEAAEAEAAKWQKAFAAQTRKLQAALDVGGDAVRAALQPKVKP